MEKMNVTQLLHDIRNTLACLKVNLQIAESEQSTSALKRATLAMSSIEQQLQSMVSTGGEKTPPSFSPVLLIMEAIDLFAGRAKNKDIQIVLMSEVRIQLSGSSYQFNRIISNLLSNAIDACPSHSGLIWINLKYQGDTLLLNIADNGCGIEYRDLQKLYNPDYTTKEPKASRGAGLFITKNLVRHEFSGSITAKSFVGLGTTFSVELPLLP